MRGHGSVGRRLKQAVVLQKEWGTRALAERGLVVLGVQSLTLVETSLDPPPPPLELPDGVRIAILARDQLDDLLALRPDVGREEALRRLDTGSRCFAAWTGSTIVWAQWVGTEAPVFPTFGFTLPLAADEVYAYSSYTSPAHRGLGIHARGTRHVRRVLASEGARRCIAAILSDNGPALRASFRAGSTPFARVVVLKLGRLPTIRLTRIPRTWKRPLE